jgi:hypothetical protein
VDPVEDLEGQGDQEDWQEEVEEEDHQVVNLPPYLHPKLQPPHKTLQN